MTLSTKLEMRQSQHLVITPQLQQAIRLLQFSNLELVAFVETELERNPLLERDDREDRDGGDGAADGENRMADDLPEETPPSELDSDDAAPSGEPDDALWPGLDATLALPTPALDMDIENVFPDAGREAEPGGLSGFEDWGSARQRSPAAGDPAPNPEAFVPDDITLKDHLNAQAALALRQDGERWIARYLIDLVDEAGYLTCDLSALAEKVGAPLALVEQVLATLQTFDPPGVCARSLSECLALQLKEQNRYDPLIATLLDHLSFVANHDLSALRRAVGVGMDELADMITELKRLNPKPGHCFGRVVSQAVVPDVFVWRTADRTWAIELNTETLPRVLVNRVYARRISGTTVSPADKTYLSECLQSANWLIRSLDQRARTILKVAEEIVRQQDGFFTYGIGSLRPLNLRTVADAVGMHESTISRVTSNKYMATPRGILEFKYFFTSSIAASGNGEAHSSETVRHRIRQLIHEEMPRHILSDDRIVELLKGDGVEIARRTVAKYREALRIPSSVQRRREKRMSEHGSRSAS